MICTFFDWHFERSKEKKPSSIEQLATSFSFLKSHKILFTNENRFECIDTVRFFASILVFLNHYYLFFLRSSAGRGLFDKDGVYRKSINGHWKYLMLRNRHIIDIHFAIRFVVGSLRKVYHNFLLILFQWFTFNL